MIRGISAGVGVDAFQKAHSVSAATEQMSSNVVSVASGMDETTTNLANVATATEQTTSTIGEIARNSEKARTIALEATVQAKRVNDQISHLSDATTRIGAVTETINEASCQTNLLALNATIEAPRAGSLGQGVRDHRSDQRLCVLGSGGN
jgi:methyl-accepting chemotaxis protein